MNIYNKFLEDLEHKNKINNILSDDMNDKLLSTKMRNSSLNALLSTRSHIKENINKIRTKYGICEDIFNQQNLHEQISQLKNKYIKNISNRYKINTVHNVNIISDSKNKIHKKESNKVFKKKTHSADLEKIKVGLYQNGIFIDKTNFVKEKMNFSLSSKELINNINDNSNKNLNSINEAYNKDNEGKNNNYQKHLRNKRKEYNKIEE